MVWFTNDLAASLSQPLVVKQQGGPTTEAWYGLDRLATHTVGSSSRSWPLHDGVGSVQATMNDAGNLGSSPQFDAWGYVAEEDFNDDPFGFTGEYTDHMTGLVYLRARWYDPASGTLLGPDPFAGYQQSPYSFNAYQYSFSNPVSLNDPSGRDPWYKDIDFHCEERTGYDREKCLDEQRQARSERQPVDPDAGYGETSSICLSTLDENCEVFGIGQWLGDTAIGRFSGGFVKAGGGAINGLYHTLAPWEWGPAIQGVVNIFEHPCESWSVFSESFMNGAGLAGAGLGYLYDDPFGAIGSISAEDWGDISFQALSTGLAARSVYNRGSARSAALADEEAAASAGRSRAVAAGANCSFTADTPVATKNGPVAIGALKVGDSVLAYNEETGETDSYTVTATLVHDDPVLVDLSINDDPITTTPEHPFFTQEDGWVPASKLVLGDHIRSADGTWGEVTSLSLRSQTQAMYNLTVDTAHTYFVGDGKWLVHNLCLPSLEDLSNAAAEPSKGGFTKAGHAFTKHGNRPGTVFPPLKGNIATINETAQGIVDGILNNPNSFAQGRHHVNFGVIIEVISPNGGLRYTATGEFIGFLEP
jgi:RHS repeat-associated protein